MTGSAVLLAGILTLPAIANAGIITIGFDELQVGEDVLNYYNGGFGSLGTGPGPSYGVSFAPGWIAGPPDVYGAPDGKSAAISGQAIMNVSAGWSGPVSFYYMGSPLVVDFFDQQNGLGNLVGTLTLPAEVSFFPAGDALPLFRSAVFTSTGDRIDALTNGQFVVPEPATAQFFLLGMTLFTLTTLCWSWRTAKGD
jgi:hypothetical protein